MVYQINPKGNDKELYLLDKDHALRMVEGNPNKYYFKERYHHSRGLRRFFQMTKHAFLNRFAIKAKPKQYIRDISITIIGGLNYG